MGLCVRPWHVDMIKESMTLAAEERNMRPKRFKVGELVIRERDGVEVTVTRVWYDRNAECPSQTVLPIIEVEDHLFERREYMTPCEITRPTPTTSV